MKTESEIYKAYIDAGLKAGDIVRMSDGSNASVLSITDSIIYFSTFRIYKVPNIRLGFCPIWYGRPKWNVCGSPCFVIADQGPIIFGDYIANNYLVKGEL